MKLSVGRVVQAYHTTWHNGIAQVSGPWAALVTHIQPKFARLRIFWADPEDDVVSEVALEPDTVHNIDDGWLWRWPNQE